jgi:hypothetical protein
VVKAQLQLLGKAYVHHYERHGVGAEHIRERAELLQHVVDEYDAVRTAFAGARGGVLAPQADGTPPTANGGGSHRASGTPSGASGSAAGPTGGG